MPDSTIEFSTAYSPGWSEGDSGVTEVLLTVNRSGDASGTALVDYFLLHGETNDADFAGPITGTLYFEPGQTSQQITIQIVGDTEVEGDEPFTVGLSNPRGAEIGPSQSLHLYIVDDDSPDSRPDIVAPGGGSDVRAELFESGLADGSAPGARQAGFEGSLVLQAEDGLGSFSITAPNGQSTGVDANGNPTGQIRSGGLTITVHRFDAATNTVFYSAALDHNLDHSGAAPGADGRHLDRTFNMILFDKDGDSDLGVLTLRIHDDRPIPQDDADSAAAGASASGNVLTDAAPGDVGDGDDGVDRRGADGMRLIGVEAASGASDSTPDTGGNFVVTGAYGALTLNTSGDYSYAANADAPAGGVDVFRYRLGDHDGSEPAVGTLRITIAGDAPPPPADTELAVSGGGALAEGDSGQTAFQFTVTRSGDVTGETLVDYFVIGDTDGADFAGPTTGTLYFAAGETQKTISIAVAGDTLVEADEDFTLGLSNPRGGDIVDGHAAATILDDDDGSPPPPPPPDEQGMVLTSDQYGDTLTGGPGADTLNAGRGPDTLTGGGGGDHFAWAELPWNAGRLTDFTPGADKLDLRQLFEASGYSGSDPVADGRLDFRADGGGNTQVYVDPDGPGVGEWPWLITTLEGVQPAEIGAGDWMFR